MPISNVDYWNGLRRNYPQFAQITAEATADMFTERGVMPLLNNPVVMNEFWNLSMAWYLQAILPPRARNDLEENGFGESFDIPVGDLVRRIYLNQIKPMNSKFRNLEDGTSVDMQLIRKGTAEESFWQYNWDYTNCITIPDMWQQIRIFTSEAGISEFVGAQMMALDSAYTAQEYVQSLESIGMGLYDTERPLKQSQIVEVSGLTGNFNQQAVVDFILAVRQQITAMKKMGPYSNAYNQAGWDNVQDIGRLKLLVRAGFEDWLAIIAATNAAPLERLGVPVDIIEVPHFGGLEPYAEAGLTTRLYPVYDANGIQLGFNQAEGQIGEQNVTVKNDAVFWKDTHADTQAVLADKGILFRCKQTPRQIAPAPHNVRGLYTTFWDTAPNQGTFWDPHYNCIAFKDSSAAATTLKGNIAVAQTMAKTKVTG